MPGWLRWTMGLGLAVTVVAVPVFHYRWSYVHTKRLREVDPGKLYRSGQMTVAGFREAVDRYHIRTIVNAQDEFPDPDIALDYAGVRTVKERELCQELGVKYVFLAPDLIPRRQVPGRRPEAIDRFLDLMDDPNNYPVLVHCKAGLHRTGVLVAVYRMEYSRWPLRDAVHDLKANGFGDSACTSANDYIVQYLLAYRPGVREAAAQRRSHSAEPIAQDQPITGVVAR